MITQLYLAIFALGLAALFLNIVMQRFKHKVALGDGEIDDLKRARSIHGNYIETFPVVLALMFFMEIEELPDALIHGFGLIMIISRAFHFHGILKHKHAAGLSRRVAGVIFVSLLIAGSGILLFKYFV